MRFESFIYHEQHSSSFPFVFNMLRRFAVPVSLASLGTARPIYKPVSSLAGEHARGRYRTGHVRDNLRMNDKLGGSEIGRLEVGTT